jgi:hypothetical protein
MIQDMYIFRHGANYITKITESQGKRYLCKSPLQFRSYPEKNFNHKDEREESKVRITIYDVAKKLVCTPGWIQMTSR